MVVQTITPFTPGGISSEAEDGPAVGQGQTAQRTPSRYKPCPGCQRPPVSASDSHCEVVERTRGSGIGALHALGRPVGLVDAAGRRLPSVKFHSP